ncbi:hypothetical protein RRG08_003287 [Elysia crispata]|uniref:Uncharacterized protein n=1 Tax=Elysia crispata TaxID=231223 RepID=A0AAE0YML6_9GAST|nr:hypothetical protein RRG08_003287 [Elysia crispata]
MVRDVHRPVHKGLRPEVALYDPICHLPVWLIVPADNRCVMKCSGANWRSMLVSKCEERNAAYELPQPVQTKLAFYCPHVGSEQQMNCVAVHVGEQLAADQITSLTPRPGRQGDRCGVYRRQALVSSGLVWSPSICLAFQQGECKPPGYRSLGLSLEE